MSSLPAAVVPRIDEYLGAVDKAVPGLVIGLYVTGSIALDDYQPAISDIDAVAVCRGRPDAVSAGRWPSSTRRGQRWMLVRIT